jgi:PAS domain S-box-containing protein
MKDVRILIAADDETLIRLAERRLGCLGWRVRGVAEVAGIPEQILHFRPHLMLLDDPFARVAAEEILDGLRGTPGEAVPFVVLTDVGDERRAVRLMKRGAREVLVKDGRFPEALPGLVERVLAQVGAERRLWKAEEARHAAEGRFRRFVERVRVGVWLLDGEDRTLYVNPWMEQLLGLCSGTLTGVPASHRVIPAHRGEFGGRVRRVREGESEGFEVALVPRNGEPIPVRILPSPPGEGEDVLLQVEDLRERRELEARRRSALRTEAFGALAAAVARDFNDLLTPLLGWSDLAEEASLRGEGEEAAEALRQIRAACGRIRERVRQLLSAAEAERIRCSPESLRELDETVRLLLRGMGRTGSAGGSGTGSEGRATPDGKEDPRD